MNKIILTKDEVLRAQKHTLSNKAAARYLGISYNVYKRYASVFVDHESGKTLFDKHLNRQGKGIKKHLGGYGKSKKWFVVVPFSSFSFCRFIVVVGGATHGTFITMRRNT